MRSSNHESHEITKKFIEVIRINKNKKNKIKMLT